MLASFEQALRLSLHTREICWGVFWILRLSSTGSRDRGGNSGPVEATCMLHDQT